MLSEGEIYISFKFVNRVRVLSRVYRLSQGQGKVGELPDLQGRRMERTSWGGYFQHGLHDDLELFGGQLARTDYEEKVIDAMSKRETGRPMLVFARGLVGRWLWTCVWGPALPHFLEVAGNAAGVPVCDWREADDVLALASACSSSLLVLCFCCCILNAL